MVKGLLGLITLLILSFWRIDAPSYAAPTILTSLASVGGISLLDVGVLSIFGRTKDGLLMFNDSWELERNCPWINDWMGVFEDDVKDCRLFPTAGPATGTAISLTCDVNIG